VVQELLVLLWASGGAGVAADWANWRSREAQPLGAVRAAHFVN
jgi:hypothetical protein